MNSGSSRAKENRAIRQEELRAKLSAGGHLKLAIDNIIKIEKLKASKTHSQKLAQYKAAAELRLRLVNKYLPDLKNVEIVGEAGGAIVITEITRTIIK